MLTIVAWLSPPFTRFLGERQLPGIANPVALGCRSRVAVDRAFGVHLTGRRNRRGRLRRVNAASDGRAFQVLNILDEYTRECLLGLAEARIVGHSGSPVGPIPVPRSGPLYPVR